MSISRTLYAAASHQRIPIVVVNAERGKTTRNHVLQLAMQKATERFAKSRSDQTMVGMARCAVPVAERSVRQRNEPPQAFTSPTPPQRASAGTFSPPKTSTWQGGVAAPPIIPLKRASA